MKLKVHNLSGEVLKTFGADGKLLIKFHTDALDSLNIKEPVFVEFDGLQVPFYFESFEIQGKRAVVAFSDMDKELWASELIGKKFSFAGTEQLVKEENAQFAKLIGYTVQDDILGAIGVISDFFDYPSNPCLEIDFENNKFLIPINKELIPKIDSKNNIIYTRLPEGLIAL